MTAQFPNTIDGLRALLNEVLVFDIGQMTDQQKRWLAREVKAGRVMSTMNYQRYPQGKRMYWIVESDA